MRLTADERREGDATHIHLQGHPITLRETATMALGQDLATVRVRLALAYKASLLRGEGEG